MTNINTDNPLNESPYVQFNLWFEDYKKTHPIEATAMTLATVDHAGWPQARVVLLKNHDQMGFTFYTNYQSNKSLQLTLTPKAQLLFFWDKLARQVRVWGDIVQTSQSDSDEYFASRHYVSQLGAWASQQSKPLSSRQELIQKVELLKQKYKPGAVPRPPHWGGWKLTPTAFEFWQGQENRLHDRFLYELSGDAWKVQRLNP